MRLKAFFISLFLVITSLFLPVLSFAQTPRPTPVVLPKSQTVNHDYFSAGNTVVINGTVNGDVYAAGGSVLVDGTVNGDVLAAGGQVTVRGTVVHNIRVAGGQIVLDGTVGGNVSTLGGNVTTTGASKIAGSLAGAGGQYSLLGPIGKEANIAAGQATVENSIGSNLFFSGGQLTLTSPAKVAGNLSYVSSTNAQIEQGASVTGKTYHSYPPQRQEPQREYRGAPFAFFAGINLLFSFFEFLFAFIIGILLWALVPNYTRRATGFILKSPWVSLGIGLLAWVLIPFSMLLLAISLLGIPLIPIEVFGLIVFTYIGKIYVSWAIGQWIGERINQDFHPVISLLVGLIVFAIISWIPILGWIFSVLAVGIGFGAVLILEKRYYLELRAKKII